MDITAATNIVGGNFPLTDQDLRDLAYHVGANWGIGVINGKRDIEHGDVEIILADAEDDLKEDARTLLPAAWNVVPRMQKGQVGHAKWNIEDADVEIILADAEDDLREDYPRQGRVFM